jgi:hypothetical protein
MIIFILVISIILLVILILYGDKMLKQEKFESNDIKLAIHTIFLLKENIPFLREWIIYHLNLGVDKIYLYDNTGSIGRNGSTKDTNKYDVKFNELVSLNDEELNKEMQSIINDYPDKIVYVKWQPKDEKGNIVYGLIEGTYDYLDKYGKENDFTAFIDTDEFLFSKNNHDLKDFIVKNKQDKYVMFQKKFIDRFCYKNKKVIEIDDALDVDTSMWGWKNIIRNNKIIKNGKNPHLIDVSTKDTIFCKMDDLRFNHFNINKKQVEYMKSFFKMTELNLHKDSSMLKYKDVIDKECKDKCSDNNKFINEENMTDTINKVCINLNF